MALDISYRVGDYNVNTALRLLGPADFRNSEPQCCIDHLVLIIQHIGLCILRILNFVCGDHQWYNNQTAYLIVQQYFAEGNIHNVQIDSPLSQRVQQLYNALEFRANGSISYAEALDGGFLPGNVQPSPTLPLMEDVAREEIDHDTSDHDPSREFSLDGVVFPSVFEGLPPEICLELYKKLDAKSLLNLLSTESNSRNSMMNDPIFYKNLLTELALKKMTKPFDAIRLGIYPLGEEGERLKHQLIQAAYEISQVQALTEPQALNESLLQDLLAIIHRLPDSYGKSYALFQTAKKLALVNPEKALEVSELLAHAYFSRRLMYSHFRWDGYSMKDRAIYEIVKIQALTNIQQAKDTTRLIEARKIREKAYKQIAKIHFLSNPLEAINEYKYNVPHHNRDWNFYYSLEIKNEALTNTTRALDRINHIYDDHWKVKAFCEIAKAQPIHNHEYVHRIFQRALDFIESRLLYESDKNRSYCMVAKAQALSHTQQALTTIDCISNDPARKIKALCAVAQARLLRTMGHDNQIFRHALDSANSIEDQSERHATHNRVTSRRAILCDLANQIFNQALDAAVSLSGTSHHKASYRISKAEALACCEIAKEEALTNPQRANSFFLQALQIASLSGLTPFYRIRILGKIAEMMAKTRFDASGQ